MTASKERVENPRRTRTRAHAEVTNSIHFPLLCNPLQSLPGMTNTYIVNANLPHAPRIWMLFWQISALFFPVFSVSKQFFFFFTFPPFPWRSETRATFLKKKKNTPPDQSLPTPAPARLPSGSTPPLSSPLKSLVLQPSFVRALNAGRRRGYAFTCA